ncbi:hypothetical protein BH11MYX1_BH11MYX1_17710 [soil metagenome]
MHRNLLLLACCALGFVASCATTEGDEAPAREGDLTVSSEDTTADAEMDRAVADDKADSGLSYLAVAKVAQLAGIYCSYDRLATAVAVARAESGFRSTATNTVGNSHGIDRGLWQINSYWHPDVSVACAFSPSCNARVMYQISSHGTIWTAWWTYKNGKHLPYMAQARAAAAAICP